MKEATQQNIKDLQREILELKLNHPYSPHIRLKNQELDRLIETAKNGSSR